MVDDKIEKLELKPLYNSNGTCFFFFFKSTVQKNKNRCEYSNDITQMQENMIYIAYEGEEELCHQKEILIILQFSLSVSLSLPNVMNTVEKMVGVVEKFGGRNGILYKTHTTIKCWDR